MHLVSIHITAARKLESSQPSTVKLTLPYLGPTLLHTKLERTNLRYDGPFVSLLLLAYARQISEMVFFFLRKSLILR